MAEKLELESVTKEIKSELMHRETEMEELKMKCLGLDSVSKLIEDVAGMLNADISKIDINKSPLSCLDSLVSSLVQKTRDTEIQYHTTKEGYGSKEMELAELKEKMHFLDTLRLENENEILVLKESLHQAEEALTVARSELHKKANELEHSEQRVCSIRVHLSNNVGSGNCNHIDFPYLFHAYYGLHHCGHLLFHGLHVGLHLLLHLLYFTHYSSSSTGSVRAP